jgi:MOSC domain-containing protein YiiM
VSGTVAAIWLKRFKRGLMDAVDRAEFVAGRGLRGNANQGGKRQVTIIDEAAWQDAQRDAGALVDPSARRANVMLRGIDLRRTRGKELRIGEAVVRVYGETRPCERMEEAHRGLRAALSPEWRGGVFAEIVSGGVVRVGDAAEWIEAQAALFAE